MDLHRLGVLLLGVGWAGMSLCKAEPDPQEAAPQPVHGISMHGDMKYADPKKFNHFATHNPEAPQGGTLRFAVVGRAFDTLYQIPLLIEPILWRIFWRYPEVKLCKENNTRHPRVTRFRQTLFSMVVRLTWSQKRSTGLSSGL